MNFLAKIVFLGLSSYSLQALADCQPPFVSLPDFNIDCNTATTKRGWVNVFSPNNPPSCPIMTYPIHLVIQNGDTVLEGVVSDLPPTITSNESVGLRYNFTLPKTLTMDPNYPTYAFLTGALFSQENGTDINLTDPAAGADDLSINVVCECIHRAPQIAVNLIGNNQFNIALTSNDSPSCPPWTADLGASVSTMNSTTSLETDSVTLQGLNSQLVTGTMTFPASAEGDTTSCKILTVLVVNRSGNSNIFTVNLP